MGVRLRYYQDELHVAIYNAWEAGAKGVLAVAATGAGKTVTFGSVVASHQGASACVAHRQELIGQISLALARFGIYHRVIAPKKVINNVTALHIRKLGRSYVNPSALAGVVSIDTLIREGKLVKAAAAWLKSVTLQVHDEGHHLLEDNKWGQGAAKFTHPLCRLLTVTATPERTDGKGLGRHADGLVDVMIDLDISLRRMTNEGYLVPHKVVMAESDVQLTREMFSPNTGELNSKGKAAVRESHIVGDLVDAYRKYTPDEPAVVFAPDIETSKAMAQLFRDAGIPALHVDGDTDDDVREDAVAKLEDGRLKVLTNVGLFGEGFDLPIIVAVYDCAATESFGNFAQRFGRMKRLAITPEQQAMWEDLTPAQRKELIAASAKPYGYYVDLVGNMVRHNGPPDAPREHTLDRRERRGGGGSGPNPITFCLNPDTGGGIACGQNYERFRACCPFCGFVPEPAGRSAPEFVNGNLTLLDADALAELYGRVIDVDEVFYPPRSQGAGIARKVAHQHADLVAWQREFRDAFAWWAGEMRAAGLSDGEVYSLFYVTYGLDLLSACALRDTKRLGDLVESLDSVLTDSSKSNRVRFLPLNS